jgi:hypothetical protein
MSSRLFVFGLLFCVVMLGACKQADNLTNAALPAQVGADASAANGAAVASDGISEGRKLAARIIAPGSPFLVELLQRDPQDPLQHPCYPLGDQGLGLLPWSTRLDGPVFGTVVNAATFVQSEYSLIALKGGNGTQYVLSVRAGTASDGNPFFSQFEFNFRAVNPFEAKHVTRAGTASNVVPTIDYLIHEADYPSNEQVTPLNRSLIDFARDTAILIQGLDINPITAHGPPGPPLGPNAHTTAWMNTLGPQAWVAYARDNAYQSGRFFPMNGSRLGGPLALIDTPNPFDDGMIRSVQVRGDIFDTISENPGHLTTGTAQCDVCPDWTGVPPANFPTQPYALFDYSNFDEGGNAAPGRAGFVFVMRTPLAIAPTSVVLDPSAYPGQDPLMHPDILMPTLGSGYNEADLNTIGVIKHPAAVNNPAGPPLPGVHELSISVFFITTGI